jgi:hypothetical protein
VELAAVLLLGLLAALSSDGEHVVLDAHLDVLLGVDARQLGPQDVGALLHEVLDPYVRCEA